MTHLPLAVQAQAFAHSACVAVTQGDASAGSVGLVLVDVGGGASLEPLPPLLLVLPPLLLLPPPVGSLPVDEDPPHATSAQARREKESLFMMRGPEHHACQARISRKSRTIVTGRRAIGVAAA